MAESNGGGYNGQEKRRHIRYKCNMDVVTVLRYGSDAKERYGAAGHVIAPVRKRVKVVDLSLGGAQVETGEPIPTGTPLEVSIETPYGKYITGRARVVWVKKNRGYNIGIIFENFGWFQRHRLKRFIKWLSSIS